MWSNNHIPRFSIFVCQNAKIVRLFHHSTLAVYVSAIETLPHKFKAICNSYSYRSKLVFLLVSILYFYNFHVNDIWTPNESFYAESVREMFKSGNFFDINYNYEARYNKPPLTYWVIALSSYVFGLNEFGIRLPIVLMALGSIWLTYLFGKNMFGEKGGFYSLIIVSLGLQLLAVKQYASPETPLTFFFTLTLYWFYRAYKLKSDKYLFGSYLALGLTVLTKGFPYIIVISGIIGLYILLDNRKDWKQLKKNILFLKLPIGLTLVGIVGLSWVVFMYINYGDSFWEIYHRETIGRALEKKSKGLQPFFYIGVIAWSIIPYSLSFFYSIIYWINNRKYIDKIILPISWVIIMLLIFTVSKGKIPTYMIQAHPALALMLVPVFLNTEVRLKTLEYIHSLMFIMLIIGTFYLTVVLGLDLFYLLVPFIACCMSIYLLIRKGFKGISKLLPFFGMFAFIVVFNSFLPEMEKYRPYDRIGSITKQKEINREVPLLLDAWLIHNLPFYTERKVLRDYSTTMINAYSQNNPTFALLPKTHLTNLDFDYQILWEGLIYDSSSESQFFKYVIAIKEAQSGNLDKFKEFTLIYKP